MDASRERLAARFLKSFENARDFGDFGWRGLNVVAGGPRGCGKTTFLRRVVEFVNSGAVLSNAHAVYMDCSRLDISRFLLDLCRLRGWAEPAEGRHRSPSNDSDFVHETLESKDELR